MLPIWQRRINATRSTLGRLITQSALDRVTTDKSTDISIEAPYKNIRYSADMMDYWNSVGRPIFQSIYCPMFRSMYPTDISGKVSTKYRWSVGVLPIDISAVISTEYWLWHWLLFGWVSVEWRLPSRLPKRYEFLVCFRWEYTLYN